MVSISQDCPAQGLKAEGNSCLRLCPQVKQRIFGHQKDINIGVVLL